MNTYPDTAASVLKDLAAAAQRMADSTSGAEKKAARENRNALIAASARLQVPAADAIAAAGIKNVSSYYDILRAAKVQRTTDTAKAKAKGNPYTGDAIMAASRASLPEAPKRLKDEPRMASDFMQEAIKEAEALSGPIYSEDHDGLLAFAARFRDGEGRDRKKVIHAMDEDDAFDAVAALAGPRGRVVSVKRK